MSNDNTQESSFSRKFSRRYFLKKAILGAGAGLTLGTLGPFSKLRANDVSAPNIDKPEFDFVMDSGIEAVGVSEPISTLDDLVERQDLAYKSWVETTGGQEIPGQIRLELFCRRSLYEKFQAPEGVEVPAVLQDNISSPPVKLSEDSITKFFGRHIDALNKVLTNTAKMHTYKRYAGQNLQPVTNQTGSKDSTHSTICA